jgi:hypothetical protein
MNFESIPVYEGLGWDGVTFYKLAINGVEVIKNKQISGYYIFRSFPFLFYFRKPSYPPSD